MKEELAKTAVGVPYRKNTRLLLAIPINVTGRDDDGLPLKENTVTLDVGKRGARFPLFQPPPVNTGIEVRRTANGEAHSARVVWRGRAVAPDGQTEIGVEFREKFNAPRAWGIPVPPEDWRNGGLQLTTEEKQELLEERNRPVVGHWQAESPDTKFEPPRLRAPQFQPATANSGFSRAMADLADSPVAPSAEGPSPREAAPAVPATAAGVGTGAGPSADSELPLIEPEAAGSHPLRITSDTAGTPPFGSHEELTVWLSRFIAEQSSASPLAAEGVVRAVQAAAKDAMAELQASRRESEESLRAASGQSQKELAALGASAVEKLSAASQESLAGIRTELAKALEALDARTRAASAVESVGKRALEQMVAARREVEKTLQTAGEEYQRKLAAESASTLQKLANDSQGLLAGFRTELAKSPEALDTQSRAVGPDEGASQAAVEQLQAARREIEDGLRASVAETQKQLATFEVASFEELKKNSESLLAAFERDLEEAHHRLDEMDAGAAQHQYAKLAAIMRDDLAGLRKEQEHRIRVLREQMGDLIRENAQPAPPPPPVKQPTKLWPLVWALAALVALSVFAFFSFVALSTQQVVRLRTIPPNEFLEVDAAWNANRQDAEQKLARAYWHVVVRDLGPSYKFGTDLPQEPPAEFWVDPQTLGDVHWKFNAEGSREEYWRRLREVWNKPEIWDESYEWNTRWLGKYLEPLGEWLRKLGS